MQERTRKIRFLLAPLDWGLGHATRCIPVIRELQAQNGEVIIAAGGAQAVLLQQEFPHLQILSLPGYGVEYSRNGALLPIKLLLQLPKLKRAIRKEYEWLKQVVTTVQPDFIISDNRYGFYHSDIPSIFVSHQLRIQTPGGRWLTNIIQRFNYNYINRFTRCWIPDFEDASLSLSGELSHPQNMPAVPAYYVGTLSRFEKIRKEEKKGHLLILLSGPEPQRTLLEEKIIDEVSHYNGTADIVRGLPGHSTQIPSTRMIQFHNHLATAELNQKMIEAEYIISRSGYSTIMDIAALNKKSILIPTPGQTEQVYLANYLEQQKQVICFPQNRFSLSAALAKAAAHTWTPFFIADKHALQKAITNLIQSAPALG